MIGGIRPAALGDAIPPNVPHTIVCSLPTWQDAIGFAEQEERVVTSLKAGYPRQKIHDYVKALWKVCSQIHGIEGEECALSFSRKSVEECVLYVKKHSEKPGEPRACRFEVPYKDGIDVSGFPEVFAVFFPSSAFTEASQFMMYTGSGISARFAELCLECIPNELIDTSTFVIPLRTVNWRSLEYYQAHKPVETGSEAKRALRRIFAGDLGDGSANIRGVPGVSSDDVYLYASGMNAIWHLHLMILDTRPKGLKSAAFNVLYSHSHNLIEGWGAGHHVIGSGSIAELEALLASEQIKDPEQPPLAALYIDFPTNPMLKSPDVARLRELADQYHVPLIIDETVGNFISVQLLPYADIVVCSLTKIISGLANVMGGALLLNPTSPYYSAFKARMEETYQDLYFSEDAICLEANTRDIKQRIAIVNKNAEAVADYLYARSQMSQGSFIKQVLYPKYQDRDIYERYLNKESGARPGYGGLLSVSFTSLAVGKVFYDALRCYKGITFGTIFTLAIPFTEMSFHSNLKWAEENGVDHALVRISIGMENWENLKDIFDVALAAAEDVAANDQTQ
ncbi:PLP-dependent transferase [Guyanagaster necrorhizus]|uniref:PLP-dependent transferase n=1 Tax=Guyanagaster necrorhizus TaxID=856835 RepID=A0A9P7VVU1_9AGAR|nr:PLP-dependent transferase [Guyanagaster necrorhizus MCA 3950]KAG7447610.1 PLP-dependent transferase [Guyanagaster necrorhizus MCA 3950]